MSKIHDIIRRPLLSEKGNILNESENKVLMEVARDANKIEVKRAVEEIFKVSVVSVHTLNIHGKKKRLGRHEGRTRSWKKAIVTIKSGENLDFLGGLK